MGKGTSLILGGTQGLGLALARESRNNGYWPVILGRTLRVEMETAVFFNLDLTENRVNRKMNAYLNGRGGEQIERVFWVAGIFLKKRLVDCLPEEIDKMVKTHLTGPIDFLRKFHKMRLAQRLPYHLTVIASTSSYRLREQESIYAMVKAAKAHFTRQFAKELATELPGSKTLLVNPGGMKTRFFDGTGTNVSKMMDPEQIAEIIWERIKYQQKKFDEFSVINLGDGQPKIVDGPQLPETP